MDQDIDFDREPTKSARKVRLTTFIFFGIKPPFLSHRAIFLKNQAFL